MQTVKEEYRACSGPGRERHRSSRLRTRIITLMGAVMLSLVVLAGCGPQRQAAKAGRLQERMEQRKIDEQAAAYEQARKRHMKLQSKKTRDRMQESAKKSEQWRPRRKTSFWKRLFGKGR